MAEIDVKIKGDDSDLKKKFEESAKQAKEFGDKIKEQLNQAKDVAVDFAGEQGLGKIASQLGSGLGIAAFGTAVVKMFTDSVEAAGKFETSITKLSFALTPATAGMAKDLEEWVETVSAGMGGLEANEEVFKRVAHLFPNNIEQAKNVFMDIQNAALKMGRPVEELGDAISEMKQTGEVPRGFFREMPELAPIVRGILPPQPVIPGETAEQAEEKIGTQMTAAANKAGLSSADWFIRNVLPMIAPGRESNPGRIAIQQTAEAKWEAVGIEFEKLKVEVGEELLPEVKRFADYLKDNLPEIGADLKGFAEALANVMKFMGQFAQPLGFGYQALAHPREAEEEARRNMANAQPAWPQIQNIWNQMVDRFTKANDASQQNAELMKRALNPQ